MIARQNFQIANSMAEKSQTAYERYVAFCKRVDVEPMPEERWQQQDNYFPIHLPGVSKKQLGELICQGASIRRTHSAN